MLRDAIPTSYSSSSSYATSLLSLFFPPPSYPSLIPLPSPPHRSFSSLPSNLPSCYPRSHLAPLSSPRPSFIKFLVLLFLLFLLLFLLFGLFLFDCLIYGLEFFLLNINFTPNEICLLSFLPGDIECPSALQAIYLHLLAIPVHA